MSEGARINHDNYGHHNIINYLIGDCPRAASHVDEVHQVIGAVFARYELQHPHYAHNGCLKENTI